MQVGDDNQNNPEEDPVEALVAADAAEEPTGDWKGQGRTSIYPVLTEHAAAEYLWRRDGDPTWFGGHNKGFDIESKGLRYEVKTAWFNTAHPGRLYFPAPLGGFDSDCCDVVVPVMLEGTSVSYETRDGGGQVTGRYETAMMWFIDVAVINELLHYEAKARSWIDVEQVTAYRVSPSDGAGSPQKSAEFTA